MQRVFEGYDLVLSPTVAVPPFSWKQLYLGEIDGRKLRTYYEWFSPTYMISLTGNPSLSLPMGLEPTGTPFGMMITGPAASDLLTLRAAHTIERAVAASMNCRSTSPTSPTIPTGTAPVRLTFCTVGPAVTIVVSCRIGNTVSMAQSLGSNSPRTSAMLSKRSAVNELAYFASWKITPTVWRWPERSRLTPWRRLTR